MPSFEKLYNGLKSIEENCGDSKTMLILIEALLHDVYKQNNVKKSGALPTASPLDTLTILNRVLKELQGIYTAHKGALEEFSTDKAARFEETARQMNEARTAISDQEADMIRLQTSETALQELKNKIEELKRQHSSNERERNRLKAKVEDDEKKIAAYKQWRKNWSQERKEIQAEIDELEAEAQILLNAWNAEQNVKFPGAAIEAFEEYRRFFTQQANEIKKVLGDFTERYKKLVDESEKLLK